MSITTLACSAAPGKTRACIQRVQTAARADPFADVWVLLPNVNQQLHFAAASPIPMARWESALAPWRPLRRAACVVGQVRTNRARAGPLSPGTRSDR